MASRPLAPPLPSRLVGALGGAAGVLTGVLLAARTTLGVTAAVGLLYGPLIFFDLVLGLTLWVPLTFMHSLSIAWSGPAVVSVLVLAAWIGTLSGTRKARGAVLARQRTLSWMIVLFVLWGALSLLWAQDIGRAAESLVDWLVAAATFFVVATTISDPRHARLLLAAFVLGGVASVVIGVATTGLHASADALSGSAQAEGRLTGGAGDPNYLAAGALASLIVAIALLATSRRLLARMLLSGATVVLVAGIVASESRGALLASAGAALAALALFKHRRLLVGTVLLAIVSMAALWFALDPGAINRVTNFNGGGTGRTDLWTVAWRVGTHHPVIGVGLENFVVHEAEYVREPGALTSVALIADKPHVVHNLYLQSFTETGVIGIALLVALIAALLGTSARTIRRFDAAGRGDLATLARAILIAEIAIFIALLFLSDGPDQRFWVLFGISGALLGLSPASRPRRTTSLI